LIHQFVSAEFNRMLMLKRNKRLQLEKALKKEVLRETSPIIPGSNPSGSTIDNSTIV